MTLKVRWRNSMSASGILSSAISMQMTIRHPTKEGYTGKVNSMNMSDAPTALLSRP